MNSVFITGIPTAGKSTLAKRVAESLGISWVGMDSLRDEMIKDATLEPWVSFFWRKDEATYLSTTTPDQHWQNIVDISEAFWPTKKRFIEQAIASGTPTIFESVNLLPRLIHELPLQGVVLLGSSKEEVAERLHKVQRWGKTKELQQREADLLFNDERPRYAAEANRYGFKTFSTSEDAEQELRRLILEA